MTDFDDTQRMLSQALEDGAPVLQSAEVERFHQALDIHRDTLLDMYLSGPGGLSLNDWKFLHSQAHRLLTPEQLRVD